MHTRCMQSMLESAEFIIVMAFWVSDINFAYRRQLQIPMGVLNKRLSGSSVMGHRTVHDPENGI